MVMLLVMQSRQCDQLFAASGDLAALPIGHYPEHRQTEPHLHRHRHQAARWLARTGESPEQVILEALGNIPTTAHLLGGAAIGTDATKA